MPVRLKQVKMTLKQVKMALLLMLPRRQTPNQMLNRRQSDLQIRGPHLNNGAHSHTPHVISAAFDHTRRIVAMHEYGSPYLRYGATRSTSDHMISPFG